MIAWCCPDDGVRSRRVHDADLAQYRRREGSLADLAVQSLARRVAVAQHVDDGSSRGDALFDDAAAEQRVDHRRFASIELADDHEAEEVVQIGDRLLQRFDVVVGGVKPGEPECELLQEAALIRQPARLRHRPESSCRPYEHCNRDSARLTMTARAGGTLLADEI